MDDGAAAPATLSPTTASSTGASHAGAGDVVRARGVPVERGLVEGRQRALADDLLGAEQALRVEDGELDRVRLRHRGEDLVEVPLHGAHLASPRTAAGCGTGCSPVSAAPERVRRSARAAAAVRRATGPVARAGGAIGMSTCAVSRYPRNPRPCCPDSSSPPSSRRTAGSRRCPAARWCPCRAAVRTATRPSRAGRPRTPAAMRATADPRSSRSAASRTTALR